MAARLTPSPSETILDFRSAGSLFNSGSATSTAADTVADEAESEKRGFSAAAGKVALGSADRPFDFAVFPLE
jgi:hypothetical protein